MSARMITPLHVYLDGRDEPLAVSMDQRDLARWEGADQYAPGRPHLQARFCGWSALVRTGQYAATWQTFNTECVEVQSLLGADDDQGGEDEQSLDPGNRPTSVGA